MLVRLLGETAEDGTVSLPETAGVGEPPGWPGEREELEIEKFLDEMDVMKELCTALLVVFNTMLLISEERPWLRTELNVELEFEILESAGKVAWL